VTDLLDVAMGVAVGGVVTRQAVLLLLAGLRGRTGPAEVEVVVDVVVPAFDEEAGIEATVRGVRAARGVGQVVVVDDGSRDATGAIARRLARELVRVVVVTHPRNRGKAAALNTGLAHTGTALVATLDADTVPDPAALVRMAAAVRPGDGAVACNVRVRNRDRALTRWQSLEYVTALHLGRRAQAWSGALVTVPGALALWRRDAVEAVGGFSGRTLAEDTDLTLVLQRHGFGVRFADAAVAWTRAPDTLDALVRQRQRWLLGNLQCAVRHAGGLVDGPPGLRWLGLPDLWWTHLGAYALLPLSVAWLAVGADGWTALELAVAGVVLLGIDLAATAVAVRMDGERWKVLADAPVQRLVLPFVAWFVFGAVTWRVARGHGVRWRAERPHPVSVRPSPARRSR
jgi:peptidoglycan-N-acetylglucosamine deacetylase